MTAAPAPIPIGRLHARRLREVYRSAGWPWQDVLEVELLAAGLLERQRSAEGQETVRVTDAGLAHIAAAAAVNRKAKSAHDALVDAVAQALVRDGRLVWTALSLRAALPPLEPGGKTRWKMCEPDVFSIRNSSVQGYLEPVVHEIKVSRADLLGDLKRPDKRQAYLDIGGQCWYVLGCNAKGAPIADADEVPTECGVMLWQAERLHVLRVAPKRAVPELPFALWMALAKATPLPGYAQAAADWGDQAPLTEALRHKDAGI
jgi:hypothetical protein